MVTIAMVQECFYAGEPGETHEPSVPLRISNPLSCALLPTLLPPVGGHNWLHVCPRLLDTHINSMRCWRLFGTVLVSSSINMTEQDLLASTEHVDGYWSCWGPWSSCGSTMKRHRSRRCDNPATLGGGQPCVGPSREQDPCHVSIFQK